MPASATPSARWGRSTCARACAARVTLDRRHRRRLHRLRARRARPTTCCRAATSILSAILIERALFLDAGVEAARTRADPLLPFSGEASTANTVSSVTWRASPYFEHEFTPTLSALVRSDTHRSRRNTSADPGVAAPVGSTVQREIVRVERKPVPVGLALEASREATPTRTRLDAR